MTTTTERVTAVRERLERASFPRAVCRLCGVVVAEGQGIRLPEGFEPHSWLTSEDQRRERAGEPLIDGWRRQHDACQPDIASVFSAVLGVPVSPAEAFALAEKVAAPVAFRRWSTGGHDAGSAKPYGWLGKAEKQAIAQALKAVRSHLEPRRCVDGACGLCGVAEATGWTTTPIRWHDGMPASLCGTCTATWIAYGIPEDSRGLRIVALERLTGLSEFGSPDFGIRYYAEVARDDEHAGYSEPWSFRPEQLDSVRERVWEFRPSLAPVDRRTEFYRRAGDRARQRAIALDAERESASRAREPWTGEAW